MIALTQNSYNCWPHHNGSSDITYMGTINHITCTKKWIKTNAGTQNTFNSYLTNRIQLSLTYISVEAVACKIFFTEQQRFVLFFLCCRGKNVGECPKSVKRKALTEAGLLPTKIPWNSLEKKHYSYVKTFVTRSD